MPDVAFQGVFPANAWSLPPHDANAVSSHFGADTLSTATSPSSSTPSCSGSFSHDPSRSPRRSTAHAAATSAAANSIAVLPSAYPSDPSQSSAPGLRLLPPPTQQQEQTQHHQQQLWRMQQRSELHFLVAQLHQQHHGQHPQQHFAHDEQCRPVDGNMSGGPVAVGAASSSKSLSPFLRVASAATAPASPSRRAIQYCDSRDEEQHDTLSLSSLDRVGFGPSVGWSPAADSEAGPDLQDLQISAWHGFQDPNALQFMIQNAHPQPQPPQHAEQQAPQTVQSLQESQQQPSLAQHAEGFDTLHCNDPALGLSLQADTDAQFNLQSFLQMAQSAAPAPTPSPPHNRSELFLDRVYSEGLPPR